MSYHHFSRLIRRHDIEPDHWLAAIVENKPHYIEAFMEAVQTCDKWDVYQTLNALDELVPAMQMDMQIVAHRKGQESPEYEAFTLSINFVNRLIGIFSQAGFYPGEQLPSAASY